MIRYFYEAAPVANQHREANLELSQLYYLEDTLSFANHFLLLLPLRPKAFLLPGLHAKELFAQQTSRYNHSLGPITPALRHRIRTQSETRHITPYQYGTLYFYDTKEHTDPQ